MNILVTGATGKLGRLVIDALLERHPSDRVVAVARNPDKARELTARGVAVRIADYDRPETLGGVFAPGDRVLLISSNVSGEAVARQHTAVVRAAKRAGVALLAYTSVLHADTATFEIGRDHRRTERIIERSGLPWVMLRNGWYNENYTGLLAVTLERGIVFGSAGEGRVATASRADYAAASALVLTGAGHENRTYELSGDRAWSLAEYAAEVARLSGRQVSYTGMTGRRYREFMIGMGVSEVDADALVDADAAIGRGELAATPGDLARLLGRPTTPIAESIAAALPAGFVRG